MEPFRKSPGDAHMTRIISLVYVVYEDDKCFNVPEIITLLNNNGIRCETNWSINDEFDKLDSIEITIFPNDSSPVKMTSNHVLTVTDWGTITLYEVSKTILIK